MPDQATRINCQACFATGDRIIRERFDREAASLLRFSALFITGKDPAFCQKMDGSFYICRQAPLGPRQEVPA